MYKPLWLGYAVILISSYVMFLDLEGVFLSRNYLECSWSGLQC